MTPHHEAATRVPEGTRAHVRLRAVFVAFGDSPQTEQELEAAIEDALEVFAPARRWDEAFLSGVQFGTRETARAIRRVSPIGPPSPDSIPRNPFNGGIPNTRFPGVFLARPEWWAPPGSPKPPFSSHRVRRWFRAFSSTGPKGATRQERRVPEIALLERRRGSGSHDQSTSSTGGYASGEEQ